MNGLRTAAVLVATVLLVPRGAPAQSSGAEVALAEVLYRQGRQLMAEGKVSEACPKFAESYRLDAATGTLLNLAACHEAEHKLATAWLEYTEAINLARRDRREDRIRFAQERLASMEPKLSRLTVLVSPAVEIAELEILLDRVPIGRAGWGVPLPVDPGHHTVEARAKGRKPWAEDVAIDRESANVTVAIPSLELEGWPAETSPVDRAKLPAGEPLSRPLPSSVYVAGTLTIGLTLAAASTGAVYLARRSKYGSSEESPQYEDTRRWGIVNLPLTAGAFIGAAATTYLYLSRPSRPNGAPATIAPWFGVASAGVVVEGSL